MADPPLGLTYVAPALDLPSWLSYTSTPTATTLEAYTVATLAPNGAPTLVTGAVEVTRYETILLQLAITVDSAADVRGQDLGTLYTTAGGTAAETVVNEVGGTRRFTLGASESTAGAGSRTAFEPTRTPAASQGAASASRSANPVSTGVAPAGSPSPTVSSRLPPSVSPGPAAASTASREQASLSSALASAAGASSAEAQALSSLSSDLASASSAATTLSSLQSASSASDPARSTSPPTSSAFSPASSRAIPSSSSATPSPLVTAADNSGSSSHSLTPSQLAAAIAAPICFFFLVVALLLLCCCCVRLRRRRVAQRRLNEEQGLLDDDGPGGAPGGILWEWVQPRRPSEASGRRSAASIKSAISRVTAGLLGGAAGRSTRSASTPGSSPRDVREKGFAATGGGAREISDEEGGLTPQQYGPAGDADVGDGVGPSTPLLGAESPGSSSPQRPPRSPRRPHGSPRAHYSDFAVPPALAAAFEDVDLASPRPGADDGEFAPPLHEMQETNNQPLSLPLLPPIPSTDGALRLSTLYDPPVITQLPPSPSSYEPPSRAPDSRDGLAGATDDTDLADNKRDTRLGYLSWRAGSDLEHGSAVSGYGPELTPPQTPDEGNSVHRVGDEDGDSNEGRLLPTTRPSAFRRSFSSELSETGPPDSSLFLNDARWTGARRHSPPPFSSFEPTATSSISYDPPILIRRDPPSNDHQVAARPDARHSTSTADSLSRYDEASSLAPSAFPLDSPLVYPSPRFSVAPSNRSRAGRQRSVESGLSLERIAASFGSLKDGLASGLGFDFDEGARNRRSGGGAARQREFSTESMTDPFQHSYQPYQRRLPTLPSPASTPPRHALHSRSSQSLRRPRSQPSLIFQSIPETSPEQGQAGRGVSYVDPFEFVDASPGRHSGFGHGGGYPGGPKRWTGVSEAGHAGR